MSCISFQYLSFFKHIIWEKFNHLFIHDRYNYWETTHQLRNHSCIQSHVTFDMWP
jgi:hypothetical protein